MPNPAWVEQQMDRMTKDIIAGKTRIRNVQSAHAQDASEG